jgi:hypothetical protein
MNEADSQPPAATAAPRSPRGAFRHRGFVLFWAARLCAIFASQIVKRQIYVRPNGIDQAAVQILLVGDVVVETHGLHSEFTSEPAHGQRGKPVGVRERDRSIDDRGSRQWCACHGASSDLTYLRRKGSVSFILTL